MKTKQWIGVLLMLAVAAGWVFAEANQGRSRGADIRERGRQAMGDRARMTESREQMYREHMAKQAEIHRAEIKELLDIKAIAEEENATKTAEAIQALIDKKNAVYQKNIEQVERARRERSEQLQKRMQQIEEQQQKPDSAGSKKPDEAVEEAPDETKSE